jgi:hypothetical protein
MCRYSRSRASIGELIADGAIGTSHTVVDGSCRRRRLETGLEAHVLEQGRFGEVCWRDVAGVIDALPPAHEVQQAIRVAIEGFVCEAADIVAVQVAIDPSDTFTGGLLDHLIRALCKRASA